MNGKRTSGPRREKPGGGICFLVIKDKAVSLRGKKRTPRSRRGCRRWKRMRGGNTPRPHPLPGTGRTGRKKYER
jgi:hypothetical protein